MAEGLRARIPDLDPILRTPYGPAANEGCIKRPMEWTPPPDGIAMCQDGTEQF